MGEEDGYLVIVDNKSRDLKQRSKREKPTLKDKELDSMGFLIGLAGHKRYAAQNAKFLMHDGSNLIWNSGAKAQDQMEFQKRVEQRIKQYVIAHSNVTSEEYDSKLRVEWYLFADEAKEKGFCDHILGVDCELDEIV